MGILLQAFTLGAIGGVIPGAILTLLLVSVLQGGMRAGIIAFLWAMISEVTVAGALLILATQLPLDDVAFMVIAGVGGAVLLYVAWQVLQLRAISIGGGGMLFTPAKILTLTATNAPLYIFWTTICFPLIWELARTWGLALAAPLYFMFFEIGWGITTFGMMLLFVFSRKTLTNERIMGKVFVGIALILAAFAVKMLITSVVFLL